MSLITSQIQSRVSQINVALTESQKKEILHQKQTRKIFIEDTNQKPSKMMPFSINEYWCSDRTMNANCDLCGSSWKNMKTYIISSYHRFKGDGADSEIFLSEEDIHMITVHGQALDVTRHGLLALGLIDLACTFNKNTF